MYFNIAEVQNHFAQESQHTEGTIFFTRPLVQGDLLPFAKILFDLNSRWKIGGIGSKSKALSEDAFVGEVAREWKKACETGGALPLSTEDNSLKFTLHVPPELGAKLLRGPVRSVITDLGMATFSKRNHILSAEEGMVYSSAFRALFELFEAYYGYIALTAQLIGPPWFCDRQLQGIYWMNGIGPEYVSMIGKHNLVLSDFFNSEYTERGSLFLQLTETIEESCSPASLELANKAVETIGTEWFTADNRDPHWVPEFKYVVKN